MLVVLCAAIHAALIVAGAPMGAWVWWIGAGTILAVVIALTEPRNIQR